MRRIVIFGATSAIAEAAARIWVCRGDRVFVVGRNSARLRSLADDLTVRGGRPVGSMVLDANGVESHGAVLDAAAAQLDGLDTVLIAHGTLPNQADCEASVPITLDELHTNALSIVSLLTLAASRFRAQHQGSIVVVSSVAGDRGRRSNYVYGSAKALVTAFASGLRQRVSAEGVDVITIKPGLVDTPMTRSFPKGVLWSAPDTVARDIVAAVDRHRAVVYTPWFWRWIMTAINVIPESLFKRMKL